MTEPRAHKKCIHCRRPYRDHIIAAVSTDTGGVRRECPDGSVRVFEGRIVRQGAASSSWSDGEIRALDTVLGGLRQGKQAKDLAVVIRSPDFESVARKVATMKETSKRSRGEADS